MLELLKETSTYVLLKDKVDRGFLNFFVQSIKENQKMLGLFKYQPLGFGIHFPMKLSVALV